MDTIAMGPLSTEPLNARLLGKPGARYCGLFPDTDAPFGSLGVFFALGLSDFAALGLPDFAALGLPDFAALGGNWVVNPPFIEELMLRAALRVEEVLVEALARGAGQTFFFLIPAWTDSEVHALLRASPFWAAERLCQPGRYHFEDPAGARVDTRAASAYFALSTEPPAARDRLEEALQDLAA